MQCSAASVQLPAGTTKLNGKYGKLYAPRSCEEGIHGTKRYDQESVTPLNLLTTVKSEGTEKNHELMILHSNMKTSVSPKTTGKER